MPACNCGGKPHLNKTHSCGCDRVNKTRRALKANLLQGSRRDTLDGKDYLVVPVVMIRSDVVMNDLLVPAEEILPYSWNGVPVTIQHPTAGKGYISANAPAVLEEFGVGTIFNSRWDSGVLKAEAWIDIQKANTLQPGLVKALEDGEPMDVSTGFFSEDIPSSGSSNGRAFSAIARNLNPDHLALLPGGTGACSWEDGCGVRANERMGQMSNEGEEKVSVSTFTKLLTALGINVNTENLSTNRRGPADDYRQMVADLISNDASPFVPADEDSLRMMSYDTLVAMRDKFIGGGNTDGGDTPNTNSKEADVADDNKGALTAEQVGEMIANALKVALPEALKANAAAAPAISAEDRAALDEAKKIVANARQSKIDRIKANTEMTDEELKTFSDAQLDVLASRIKAPVGDYSGRGLSVNFEQTDGADDAVEAMTAPHVNEVLKQLSTNGKAN